MLAGAISRLLCFALACCAALPLIAAPKVALVTMDPGQEYWARYGHNALLVVDGDEATSYNFGYFDFEQPGFLARFLRGDMRYRLVALPFDEDIAGYAAEGRGVRLQWLNLDARQASELAAALATNALPENAEYRYEYYRSNCSTRVRDALNAVLDDELRRQTRGRSHGMSFRSESLRMAAPVPWMAVGIHFGLGPATDRVMSVWDEAFLPEHLAAAVDRLQIGGRPLVHSTVELVAPRLPGAPAATPDWVPQFAIAGLLLLGLFALAYRPTGSLLQRVGAGSLAAFWGVCGLAGCGLLALWLGTDHSAAWANRNLLLASPLCLALLAAIPPLWRGDRVPTWLLRIAQIVLLGALLAVVQSWLLARGQRLREWIVLLLPAHVMAVHLLSRAGRRELQPSA